MASKGDSAGSVRPRSRRSIAHVPRSKTSSGIEKENTTTDIGAIKSHQGNAKPAAKDKKSRSKSLGPGGLDALQNSNGNRRKSTVPFPLKSILKPTVPVSPVRNIPSFEETRRRTPARGPQQSLPATNDGADDQSKEGLLIDFETPTHPSVVATDNLANPFDSFNATSAIRDGMAAAKEREGKERRERERQKILEQREARRKSMANRRVSFAPEATLHTWNVVEIADDSTSSSTSNSTRRTSSLQNSENQEPAQEPPSSPFNDADSDAAFSPVRQQDLQQLRDRPASNGYENAGSSQELSSSPFSGSSTEGSEDTGVQSIGRDDNDDDDNSSDSDAGFDAESTAMSMDMTVRSGVTTQSDDTSTTSSARLNEALRQAAREAGTRGIEYDENGDMSMEIADQGITGAFKPWIKKGQRQSFDWDDISALHDQENVDPSKRSMGRPSLAYPGSEDENEDLSMDMTNALGQILSKPFGHRQSVGRRKSSGEETTYEEQTMEFTNVVGGIQQPVSPAKSIGVDSNVNEDEEMTMEFTSVVGGLLGKSTTPPGDPNYPILPQDPEESHSVEPQSYTPVHESRNFVEASNEGDDTGAMDMEFTGAVGGILPPPQEQIDNQEDDQTMGMEITTAIGGIIQPGPEADDRTEAKVTELESDSENLASSTPKGNAQPPKSPISFHLAAIASESGSPSLASVRSRLTRRSSRGASSTPSSTSRHTSPTNKPSTPQQPTQGNGPLTPSHTTTPSNNMPLDNSQTGQFQPESQEAASKRESVDRKSLFQRKSATGESTPLFVLQPRERRSSGLGIDREGLGSPSVAAMLDKRRSIGDEAPQFVPRVQGVRFEDPLKLHAEVDREREEEEKREDGHILPEKDATSSLKEMISSLTPKKNNVRGRKSLHIGAAKGLLGKRPIELDMDDEEVDDTPKRLRGPDASPVKNIKLPAPTKDETALSLSARSPAGKALVLSPTKASTTPVQEPRSGLMDLTSPLKHGIESLHLTTPSQLTPSRAEEKNVGTEEPETKFEPIQLQEFLNLTNIHFMELTTTKRRHTTAPGSAKKSTRFSSENGSKLSAANFEDCVAAGFCTLPMLELYQHSCRELKSYISEGRQVIRSIETETYAENPPLFREYLTAAPDIRLLMDNQFRNVKTHARFLSKATWYEWRMKLLDGLKEGLNRHVEEMKGDDDILSKHETILNNVVSGLVEKHSSLEEEATSLQRLVDEMESCDQDELRNAREKLSKVEAEIELKKRQLQELQEEIQDKTDTIETAAELKAEYMAQIQEAERVKEECRGWSAREINELKASVLNLERQTGWSIVSASSSSSGSPAGPLLTMCYRDQLRLSFHPGAFSIENASQTADEKKNMPLELVYSPGASHKTAVRPTSQLSPIASLILKSLQNHIATIQQSTVTPKQLLRFISETWDRILGLEEEARMLEFCGVTKLTLTEDSENDKKPSLRARCTLLSRIPSGQQKQQQKTPTRKRIPSAMTEKQKRIDIDFSIKTRIIPNTGDNAIGTMHFDTDVTASKVYGFGSGSPGSGKDGAETGLSEREMREILCKELGVLVGGGGKKSDSRSDSVSQLGNGVWWRAVKALDGVVF